MNNGHDDKVAELTRERDQLHQKIRQIEQAVMTLMDLASNYMAATRDVRAGLNSNAPNLGELADRADEAERKLEQMILLARQHGLTGREG